MGDFAPLFPHNDPLDNPDEENVLRFWDNTNPTLAFDPPEEPAPAAEPVADQPASSPESNNRIARPSDPFEDFLIWVDTDDDTAVQDDPGDPHVEATGIQNESVNRDEENPENINTGCENTVPLDEENPENLNRGCEDTMPIDEENPENLNTGSCENTMPPDEENTENMNRGRENTMPLAVWPPAPVLFSCSSCQVLREIIHRNGSRATRLEIHGRVGIICHAIREIRSGSSRRPPNIEHVMIDFSTQSIDSVKQFLVQYCQERRQAGFVMCQDPLSAFYDALCAGQNWDETARRTNEFIRKFENELGSCSRRQPEAESGVNREAESHSNRPPRANRVGESHANRPPHANREAETANRPPLANREAESHANRPPHANREAEIHANRPPHANREAESHANREAESRVNRPARSNLAAQRERTGRMTLEDLKAYFSLTMEEASRRMGVCPTVLKKVCRKHGINRWPHRKIKSLDRQLANLQLRLTGRNGGNAHTQVEIERLMQERARILSGVVT